MIDNGRRGLDALIRRLEAGDTQAADDIVQQYAQLVRATADAVLRSRKSQPVGSSSDVCQLTFWDFLRSAAEGRFADLRDDDLRRILLRIARSRARDQLRRRYAACRDARRVVNVPVEALGVPARSCRRQPPRILPAEREQIAQALERLPAADRALARARLEGRPWKLLAGERGTTPQALCERFRRICDRIRRELVRATAR